MIQCAYCENSLICEGCGAAYAPASAEAYEALSRPEYVIACPTCEAVLVCHWCKTPYDGGDGGGGDDEA